MQKEIASKEGVYIYIKEKKKCIIWIFSISSSPKGHSLLQYFQKDDQNPSLTLNKKPIDADQILFL